jgi:hypothetical protein
MAPSPHCMKPLSLHCIAARTTVLLPCIAVQWCEQRIVQEDYP